MRFPVLVCQYASNSKSEAVRSGYLGENVNQFTDGLLGAVLDFVPLERGKIVFHGLCRISCKPYALNAILTVVVTDCR